MSTPILMAAPDLDGLTGLPSEARTIWRPAHTPEEPWDDHEVTPAWFQNPRANASTHYYADSDGDLWQMVRNEDFAWAQGVRRDDRIEPRPVWWRDEFVSYNTCMISIEIEGYANEIGATFVPGSRQFESVAAWSAFICEKYQIPFERHYHVGHNELTRMKSDPGRDFPWSALLERVRELSSTDSSSLQLRVVQLERRVAILEAHTHGPPQ